MKKIYFRVPEEMQLDLLVELEFGNVLGQRFLENTLWEKLRENRESDGTNARGETRRDIRKRLASGHESTSGGDKKGTGEKSAAKSKKSIIRRRAKTEGRSHSNPQGT